ncbi:hypothetical protein HHK36_032201 [Tetracentron sinense]|uniref:Phospholipid/glycerol acyltransferase domain-containing protein n=1 Tax=Tetracentron sinense TaxID=13715 RepID=A0A835CZS2_TETSI|nr:hypothetical protein HHK36_032201 [Tetracentron sinense]
MFSSISKFSSEGRENHSIVSKMEGTLLISMTYFPYFMLVAFEAGGPFRALLLLFISPLVWLLESLYLETIALHIMVFISMAGLKVTEVKAVAKAVLARFFLEDLRESAFKVFSSCGGKKYVVTSMPRLMVESFLREYLDVDCVLATELRTFNGYCLGLVAERGLTVGVRQLEALGAALGEVKNIRVGLGDTLNDLPFMLLCQEGYIVPVEDNGSPLPKKDYPKPLIFHDGRLVAGPTPLDSLAVLLWLPLGFLLAISRLLAGKLPYKFGLTAAAATGMKIRAKLPPKLRTCKTTAPYSRCTCESCDPGTYKGPCIRRENSNTLYVCSHRTLMDPVIVASTLQRHVTAVTYSVSRISELLSPIRTIRLSRDRAKDGEMMRELLKQGDLVVCPEGTTCREPYLLRFSPLFAEIADKIVPVAVSAKGSMFYGTTVRGHKWLDSFFFLMNPNPEYSLEFLEAVNGCNSVGMSSYDVANQVQEMIGRALGFECTNFTRRDKIQYNNGPNQCSSDSSKKQKV